MDLPTTKHEKTKIDEYIDKGYTASYRLKNGKLRDLKTDKCFEVNEVTIVDSYRYEGMSNPSDMSIMYALKTVDGRKGTLLLPYGPHADAELDEFMKEVSLDMKNRNE